MKLYDGVVLPGTARDAAVHAVEGKR